MMFFGKKTTDESKEETAPKDRSPRRSSNPDSFKQGRWVAPTILLITALLSAIFWLFQT
jgi:hypothetical protein